MTKPEFTDEVILIATEIYDWVDNEMTDGIWRDRISKLTDAEKAGLFAAIADAFNDTTEE